MNNESMNNEQVRSRLVRRVRTWAQGQGGRFLLTQLTHTATTAVVLAALLLGAARVGALDSVLTPLAAPTDDTSFTTINYQGRLADASGNPISDTITLQFALYDSDTEGNLLWGPETHPNVPVSEGLFSVRLGSQPLPGGISTDVFSGGDVWLETIVEGETLSPREKLTAVPYAMQAGHAAEADTVPDGSITNAKLSLDGNLYLGGDGSSGATWSGNYTNLIFVNEGGNIRAISADGTYVFIDSDDDTTDAQFRILRDSTYFGGGVREIWSVNENGRVEMGGTLDMNGNSIINQGAMVEANLQTLDELAADTIDRFSEGDVLCWSEDRLELCTRASAPLVQAVANEDGKPIVIGAEVVKVLGPVQSGDLLVASDVPGYAMVEDDPRLGTVIAQALEDFEGEQGLIRAMIRKF